MFDRVVQSSSRRSKHDGVETDDEKKAKNERENQQLLVYLFVCIMLILAWFLGLYGASFFWVFGLIALTFAVWWNKAMGLLDKHLRQQELLLHRRRALRQSETTEWINFLINRWWVFSSAGIADLLKRHLDPLLQDIKPPYLEHIEVKSFDLGDKTPFVKYVHVHEYTDGGKRPMAWTNVGVPPTGLSRLQTYQLVLEADVGLLCEDFKMIFTARLGGKRMGMNMDLAVERLTITGKLQLIVHLDMDTAFPHVSSVTASFIEKPEVLFAVRVCSVVQIMEIPLLKAWLQRVVEDGFTHALVDPGKVDFKFETHGPTNIPDKVKSKCKAEGVLTVTISGENLKGSVFVDDTRYCQLRVRDEKQHTQHRQAPSQFQDSCSFLVYNLKQDQLIIKSKTKILLSTQTLAQFTISLADHPLLHKDSVDIQLESKISKTKLSGATINLDVKLKYTPITPVDTILHQFAASSVKKSGKKKNVPQPSAGLDMSINCGVLYICVHNAIGLLGLDRNGYSDPYCTIYNSGKKIKTTHYISQSKNPTWDVSTEVIIGDFSKSMLSFIVYDWDGSSMSEDDFLGSAHMILSKDEPVVVQKSLTLGYNLLNVGQVDNNKLGSITVSAIFRPVPNVANTDPHSPSAKQSFEYQSQNTTSKGFISSASDGNEDADSKKVSKRSAVKELLSTGQGLLELNLHQAKDLVAADSNGFSDPYCEVRLNDERKFVTSVKKKTLNPVWDEWVTLPLPKPNESLELIVWDKDAFFQKDFLGAVTFTLDDLKRYSKNTQHPGWFELQRTRSGWIEVHFQIISDDLLQENFEAQPVVPELNPSPQSLYSQADSGILIDKVTSQLQRNPSVGSNVSRRSTRSNKSNRAPKTPSQSVNNNKEGPVSGKVEVTATNITSKPDPNVAVKTNDTVKSTPPPSWSKSVEQTTPSSPAVDTGSRKKKGNLTRSASDVDIKGKTRKHRVVDYLSPFSSLHRSRKYDSMIMLGENGRSGSRSSSISSLSTEEKFHWVQGTLGQVKGLSLPAGHIYCKLRLDNRTQVQRMKKFSQGQVISKTANLNICGDDITFDHSFQVDYGYGVAKEALLIFDIKTSHKEHLATKGYLLQDLLQGENEIRKWVPVENGLEMELSLSLNNREPLTRDKSKGGFFSSFRRSKAKLKEQ